jgi:hypothetical protein
MKDTKNNSKLILDGRRELSEEDKSEEKECTEHLVPPCH